MQLASGCKYAGLVTPGSVQSRLKNYFNTSCIADWPVIGDDGVATGFGNSGVGILTGPGQTNLDISFGKSTRITERFNLAFRAEFFNAFNTPQFSNPVTDSSASNFGFITSTAVAPRIIQLGLKLGF